MKDGADFASGKSGQAFAFDGIDDKVVIPYSPTLVSSRFSIDAWVKPLGPVDDPINQEIILGQSNGIFQMVVRPGTSGLNVGWFFRSTDGPFVNLLSNQEIPIGSFSHLAGTWDGITLRLYINGELDSQLSPGKTPVLSNACPFTIGGFGVIPGCSASQQFFKGIIDEVRVYNEALGPSRVKTNFELVN